MTTDYQTRRIEAAAKAYTTCKSWRMKDCLKAALKAADAVPVPQDDKLFNEIGPHWPNGTGSVTSIALSGVSSGMVFNTPNNLPDESKHGGSGGDLAFDALVERVAIAACCKHDNGDPFNWQFWHEYTKNKWREIARAAIQAMQPKTEG